MKQEKITYNGLIQPLLTDLYEITMAYAYWKSEKINDYAVFDLFFRKNPFGGEFTIFAGLEECMKFLQRFRFSVSDIEYLKNTLPPGTEDGFFEYLRNLTAENVTVYAMDEGNVAFPRVPLMRIEGPLIITQLLETTFLTLVNYASLIATNAARYRLAAGQDIRLLEFGLRRAQGPDGGISASRYSYIGGFDGTSNVLAGKLFNIPVKGTHAHAFVTSYFGVTELGSKTLCPKNGGQEIDLVEASLRWRKKLIPIFKVIESQISSGELAAFISYAHAFPNDFLALIDTYDVLKSGLINFSAVALALSEVNYRALGVRLDSGDLAYLSTITREYFVKISDEFSVPWFKDLTIIASNDINEETILSINEQGHSINCYGIGTHLVTCQKQPALGGVYKLVELNGQARIKLSQDVGKITIPGRKNVFRLYNKEGHALIDLMQKFEEDPPKPGQKVLCRHAFLESKRAYVYPSNVEPLYKVYWQKGNICQHLPHIQDIRKRVRESLNILRPDIKRSLNPTPYKVSVSAELFSFIHTMWLQNAPIGELF